MEGGTGQGSGTQKNRIATQANDGRARNGRDAQTSRKRSEQRKIGLDVCPRWHTERCRRISHGETQGTGAVIEYVILSDGRLTGNDVLLGTRGPGAQKAGYITGSWLNICQGLCP